MRTQLRTFLIYSIFLTPFCKADWINIEASTDKSLNPKVLLIGQIHELPGPSKKYAKSQSQVDRLNFKNKEEIIFTKKKVEDFIRAQNPNHQVFVLIEGLGPHSKLDPESQFYTAGRDVKVIGWDNRFLTAVCLDLLEQSLSFNKDPNIKKTGPELEEYNVQSLALNLSFDLAVLYRSYTMGINILDLLKQNSEAKIVLVGGAFHIKDGIAVALLKENNIPFQAVMSPTSASIKEESLEELVKKYLPQKPELIEEIRRRAISLFTDSVNKNTKIPLDKSQGLDALQLKQVSQYMDKLDWMLSQKPIQ